MARHVQLSKERREHDDGDLSTFTLYSYVRRAHFAQQQERPDHTVRRATLCPFVAAYQRGSLQRTRAPEGERQGV